MAIFKKLSKIIKNGQNYLKKSLKIVEKGRKKKGDNFLICWMNFDSFRPFFIHFNQNGSFQKMSIFDQPLIFNTSLMI